MDRKIIINDEQNPEKNFFTVKQDILRIAKDYGISVTEVIDDFISDLQNLNNPDYDKKIENIEILGSLSDKLLKSLMSTMKAMRKNYRQKERIDGKKSKLEQMKSDWQEIENTINKAVLEGNQGTEKQIIQKLISYIDEEISGYEFDSKEKKYLLKRLNGRLDEINKQEVEKRKQEEAEINKRETANRDAEQAMIKIEEVVATNYKEDNVAAVGYWKAIRDAITGEKTDTSLNIKLGKQAKEQLLNMLDDRINTEQDELYYQQVKNFTNNFQFLKDYTETARAIQGARNAKFTDKESYDRYYSLRLLLQEGYDEYEQVGNLLESGELNSADVRILTARKDVMDKAMENAQRMQETR